MTQDLQEKIKYLLNERIEACGNEWRWERMYKKWKATKSLSTWCQRRTE